MTNGCEEEEMEWRDAPESPDHGGRNPSDGKRSWVALEDARADLGEVEVRTRRGRVDGDAGDVELQHALVGEAELLERDDGARVRPDHRRPDLARQWGRERKQGEGEGGQERRGLRRRRPQVEDPHPGGVVDLDQGEGGGGASDGRKGRGGVEWSGRGRSGSGRGRGVCCTMLGLGLAIVRLGDVGSVWCGRLRSA